MEIAYKKSFGILDYSHNNIPYYPEAWLNKITYFPIPLNNIPFDIRRSETTKKYDVLFFGGLNKRRKKILLNIENNTNLKIKYINRVFGEELNNLIRASRIILNIHYERKSILETARIHDILKVTTNASIISEESIDIKTMEKYNNLVVFIPEINNDLSNINNLLETIQYAMNTNLTNNLQLIINKKKIIYDLNENIVDIYKKTFKNYIDIMADLHNYPYLFHKYRLNIINPCTDHLNYKIIQTGTDTLVQNNLAHLHCYDISKFDEIYKEYILVIKKYFKIIVTFSVGINIITDKEFVILKIPNKGMDIGGKFIIMDYLKRNNIKPKFIFMLHSKQDKKRRDRYFKPFFKSLSKIVETINNINNEVGICVPNIIHGKNNNKWGRNTRYVKELLSYLNITYHDNIFPEGNCYIINTHLAKELFGDKKIYNCLNNEDSFDINWVKWYYNIKQYDIDRVYKYWKRNKLYGNNIQSKRGYKGQPDGQIEHAFERIVFHICKKYKKKIIIAPFE